MSHKLHEPLPREEVIAAVERKGGHRRVPLVRAKWWGEGWGEGLLDQYADELGRFADGYEDTVTLWIDDALLDPACMGLSFFDPAANVGKAIDANVVISDWNQLDEYLAKLPDPEAPGLFDDLVESAEKAHLDNRYLFFGLWRLFFERPWGLRGMETLMLDYYDHPEQVHRLLDGLCNVYCGLIRRAARDLKPDAFWTSDDLGNQRQLMMRPEHFHEFMYPYYCRVGQVCRDCGMHFWLHSCGNNTEALDDLIDAGVDVFHPVQKHTMDERVIADRFKDRLTFLAGLDVQHTLQEASAEEVRREVRFLIDTFDRPDGGMALAAGNAIVAGTPLTNIEAFLDEAVRYGVEHRSQFA